jgi:hypothetical protein
MLLYCNWPCVFAEFFRFVVASDGKLRAARFDG